MGAVDPTPPEVVLLVGFPKLSALGLKATLSLDGRTVVEMSEHRDCMVPDTIVFLYDQVDTRGITENLLARFVDARAVALTANPTAEVITGCFQAGVFVVADIDCSSDVLRFAVSSACSGYAVLPELVLAATQGPKRSLTAISLGLDSEERKWLTKLAQGYTVAALAEETFVSRRQMCRLLADLYRKMGAINRTDAILLAHSRGWLTETIPVPSIAALDR